MLIEETEAQRNATRKVAPRLHRWTQERQADLQRQVRSCMQSTQQPDRDERQETGHLPDAAGLDAREEWHACRTARQAGG